MSVTLDHTQEGILHKLLMEISDLRDRLLNEVVDAEISIKTVQVIGNICDYSNQLLAEVFHEVQPCNQAHSQRKT